MDQRTQGLLADFIKRNAPKAQRKAANQELDRARGRLKTVINRAFENEIGKLKELIQEPDRYSVKEWEKVITDLEWTARRFLGVAERMEDLRPLVMVDNTPKDEAARVTCNRLLAESFME
jgi:hypothetical protein